MTEPGSSFDRLVQSVYAAAGDASAWSAFIEDYVETAGCAAACLFHAPVRQTSARIEVAAGIDPAMIRAFDQYYSRINPYGPALARRRAGEVVTLGALVPRSEERHSEFYNDYVVPQRHHVAPTFARVLAEREVTSTLGLFSTSPKKDEVERVTTFQKRFVGHLQCALRVHAQIVDLKAQASDLLTALEYRGIALLSVDRGARVVSMTRHAASILARNDGLSYEDGAIEARSAQPVSLARALTMVTGVERGGPGDPPPVLRVARHGHTRGYELLLCAVLDHQPGLCTRGARALVFIFDPSSPPVVSAEFLLESYDLTKAEARVVQHLVGGESPPEIAQRLRVSRETVKSHLSAAYAKTGTRGQSELLATVLTGVASMPPPSED